MEFLELKIVCDAGVEGWHILPATDVADDPRVKEGKGQGYGPYAPPTEKAQACRSRGAAVGESFPDKVSIDPATDSSRDSCLELKEPCHCYPVSFTKS